MKLIARTLCLAVLTVQVFATDPSKPKLEIYLPGNTTPEPAPTSQIVAWGHLGGTTELPLSAQSGLVAISAGLLHNVALTMEGRVLAWGSNQFGQANVPASALSGVVAIAAGSEHTVALKLDGSVIAWGDNSYGQTSVPSAALSGVVAIAAADSHTVALKKDGSVIAWGNNRYGQTTVPTAALSGVIAIAAGGNSTMALKKDGSVLAWGGGNYTGTAIPNSTRSDVVAISAGWEHAVALKKDGSVVAWGLNSAGQTNVPATAQSSVVAIAAGTYHTVALKADGSVVSWGWNNDGQTSVPTEALAGVTAISAGYFHSVALKSMALLTVGEAIVGGSVERSITLRNTGTLDLQSLAAEITGSDATLFSITNRNLATTLVVGSATDLVVRFTPQGQGKHRALLKINSSDPDHTPYWVELNGTSLTPEIAVEAPNSIDDGSTLDLGYAPLEKSVTRTLTIRNIGRASLESLSVSKDGVSANDFTFDPLSNSSLAEGSSQTLTVRFQPSVVGQRTATIHIASNDEDENPFNIVLTGRGTAIDLTFAGDSGDQLNRPIQEIALGSIDAGKQTERSFTLLNRGSQALTGLRLEIAGTDANQVSITPPLASNLEAGASFTFTVRFSALLASSVDSTIRLLTDHTDEPPIILHLTATVRAANLVVRDAAGVFRFPNKGYRVFGWGSGYNPATTPETAQTDVVAVAAGSDYSLALKADGSVFCWLVNFGPMALPKAATTGVTSISAAERRAIALKNDGGVIAWNFPSVGTNYVPPTARSSVVAVALGRRHQVVLKQDGSVFAWSDSTDYALTTVPEAALTDVIAISAGEIHTLALKRDGSVVAWGHNDAGQSTVPASLSNVTAISAGQAHSMALRRDGSVVAWGSNIFGQTKVPADLTDVVAITAGEDSSLAIKRDGSVVAWGILPQGRRSVPEGAQFGAVALAAGYHHMLALVKPSFEFGVPQLEQFQDRELFIDDQGTLPLNFSATIEGSDADQFSFVGGLPGSIANGESGKLTLRFKPTHLGQRSARLKIVSNDPAKPIFELPLNGISHNFELTATKANVSGSNLTYGPLTLDSTTGLMLQKITFANTTGVGLNGLRLTILGLAAGIKIPSSSEVKAGASEVLYSSAIPAGATVSFYVAYADPMRRKSDSIQPKIKVEALLSPEPPSLPVTGTLTSLLKTRDLPLGPLLEWTSKAKSTYVVEYSDDGGNQWFSAVHRLLATGTRMIWEDRGQPETAFKPANKAARMYRVKML